MANEDVTINDLAVMVQKGFNDVTEKMATKVELESLEMKIDKRFDSVEKRFDKIEHLILADHKSRIERLEIEVKELKDLLAFK